MFHLNGIVLNMHILFLTDNFPPEGNAPASRTFDHTKEWVDIGHKVTVITCAPNFPEGKLFKGYKNRWVSKEVVEGINVWRVKTYITANTGFIKRSIDFISFMFSSFFFGMFVKRVDVVVGTSPQFFTVISAWALAKIKRSPFVFELRDIWPASIEAVGAVKSNWVIKVFENIELFLYKQAELIISVTHSFKNELIQRGIDHRKIKVVLNGVDLEKYKPVKEKDRELVKNYGLNNKFVVGYVGTHGMAHALESVLDAAELSKNNNKVKFLFVGGGADRHRLEVLVEKRKLTNVIMMPLQPKDKMPSILSLLDISLVHLKNTPLFKTVIPSKIFESMAMGLPIIISIPEGEATKMIENLETGVVVPAEDSEELSNKINELSIDTNLINILSSNSIIAAKQFSRKKLAKNMLKYLEEIV
jgi:colanic acid biosynthesis glycosyl transferase WcaI